MRGSLLDLIGVWVLGKEKGREIEKEREGNGSCSVCSAEGLFWGEIDIGLDIITVFRVLFIFNNFIFINNANMENCESFKSFSYIYIYIDI